MTTFVGTQSDFIAAVKELIELDYDAIEAYDTAINRLEDEKYKSMLKNFKADHERHVTELNSFLKKHNEDTVTGPSAKQWLAKGKVVLANLVGDNAILNAMISNEDDTNTAYENINKHEDKKKWTDIEDILERGLADERKHKRWLEDNHKDWLEGDEEDKE